MSLTNTSQVLLRNIDYIEATAPLFVNFPADDFINDYLAIYSTSKVTCYNTQFDIYQALHTKYKENVDCKFSSEYQTNAQHDLLIIAFPKSKAELAFTLAMLAPYLTENASVLLVGENKGGIKSCAKLTTNYLDNCSKIDSARHCSLFSGQFNNIRKPFTLSEWFTNYTIKIAEVTLTIASLPGVFSQDGLDVGTELLLHNLPKNMQSSVLDFGCGAGVISCYIGKKFQNIELSLLDVNALALASATKTLEINGLSGLVFPSNGLSKVTKKYQQIVSNPPFHQGIKTNYEATETFLKTIKNHMQPKGSISIVANSFLRYKPIMEQTIGKSKTLAQERGFAIYHANLQ